MVNCSKCGQRIYAGPQIGSKRRRGAIVHFHRICPVSKVKPAKPRTYQLDAPKKIGWGFARQFAVTEASEISRIVFPLRESRVFRGIKFRECAVDHIVPERLAAATGKDPHARVNLICLSLSEHAKKRRAEDNLCKSGDVLTYLAELAKLGWPMDRVRAALDYYEIRTAGTP